MSAAYASGGQDDTTAGKVILLVASSLSAILVIAGLIYATGAGTRHMAALLAADCEPSLFISGLPCTTQQMMITQYEAIVPPASKQLNADMVAYTANEGDNLAAAEAALTAEVGTEQALDNSLAAVTFTPQNRATALALITNAASNGNPVPLAAVTFTPQSTVIADALVQANQALAKLTAEQARSSSLARLRSFNHRVRAASAAVKTDMNLLLKAIELLCDVWCGFRTVCRTIISGHGRQRLRELGIRGSGRQRASEVANTTETSNRLPKSAYQLKCRG